LYIREKQLHRRMIFSCDSVNTSMSHPDTQAAANGRLSNQHWLWLKLKQ